MNMLKVLEIELMISESIGLKWENFGGIKERTVRKWTFVLSIRRRGFLRSIFSHRQLNIYLHSKSQMCWITISPIYLTVLKILPLMEMLNNSFIPFARTIWWIPTGETFVPTRINSSHPLFAMFMGSRTRSSG